MILADSHLGRAVRDYFARELRAGGGEYVIHNGTLAPVVEFAQIERVVTRVP
jgi:hypothetical protein